MKIFEWLAEFRYRNSVLYQLGMVHFIVAVILLPGLIIDPREIMGINPWIKPIKFFLSTMIFFFTMCWFLFELRITRIKWVKAITWIYAITFSLENIIILLQAFRGERSHFNIEAPLDGILFGLMGIMIIIITCTTLVVLILFLLHKSSNRIHLLAVRSGLALHLIGSLIGGVMIQRFGHAVGVADGGEGLPFLNWSTVGGDLRIGHFMGLHALQLIPLFAYFLKTKTNLNPKAQLTLTIGFILLYAWFMSWLFSSAMAGKPLISF